MTRPWTYRTTAERLRIFVSSRIKECSEERAVVRAAIGSTNHAPILFEHLGARPYGARDLYLSQLRDSNAMVAIYRTGYGYVDAASGMSVSGLDDEYRFCESARIPALIYVYGCGSGEQREARLETLIQRARAKYTVAVYNAPAELEARVRNDLTALITEQFLRAPRGAPVRSDQVLDQAGARDGLLVERTDLLQSLGRQSETSPIVCVSGAAGVGKSVLVAQFAAGLGSAFASVSGLAPREVFDACAAAVRRTSSVSQEPQAVSLEAAREQLTSAWASIESGVLVLDECDCVPEVIDALVAAGGVTTRKRLVYTSRAPQVVHPGLSVPPFTPAEVDEFLRRAQVPAHLMRAIGTGHTALNLQQALARLGSGPESLGEMRGSAGEVVRYLALSSVPLSAEELIRLRDDRDYDIETLYADIRRLGRLVKDGPQGLQLMHAQTGEDVVALLRETPQRLRFFAGRLVRMFELNSRFGCAFHAAAIVGDGGEWRYAGPTVREAARSGDWRLAVSLSECLLERALDVESKSEAFHLMLSTVYPLELMGNAARAAEVLAKARPLAELLGPSAESHLRECEISSRARRGLSAADVAGLEAVHRDYRDSGLRWDEARVGLELSALYMAAKRFERAVEVLRPTLSAFEALDDNYGVDLTQRNLAMSLSALPGNEEEAERLIALVQRRASHEADGRRQRAWMCNVLTRRLRRTKRLGEAEVLAREAIGIAEALGDESLRAINLLNLANIERDQDKPAAAIASYEAAAVSARKCGRRDIEADCSRLTAQVLNDFSPIDGYEDGRELARLHALHAIGIARDSHNRDTLGSAFMELGAAEDAKGDSLAAAKAFFEAARVFIQEPDANDAGEALLSGARAAIETHEKEYLQMMAQALGVPHPVFGAPLVDAFLSLARQVVERVPQRALIPLLTLHLKHLWSHVPQAAHGMLASAVADAISDVAGIGSIRDEPWHVLYSAVVLCYLLDDKPTLYIRRRLSDVVMRGVTDVFARDAGDGTRIWTVVLELGLRVTVSILALDDTATSDLAAFALAMFLKAFEEQIHFSLLGGAAVAQEVLVQVVQVDHMPADIKRLADQTVHLSELLSKQHCAVSRPTEFGDPMPTLVFLAPTFRSAMALDDPGGAHKFLFALTLIELTYQLLRGQVEMDAIRPKVISLVGRAMP